MALRISLALLLAFASAVLINVAYLREHDAVATLPPLSMRRPLQSLAQLLAARDWLRGFAMESAGFALYVAALALADLALVQSVAAGGVGVLALSLSLAGSEHRAAPGATVALLAWLGATGALAALVLAVGRVRLGTALAHGIAGGLLFSAGDLATKIATQGGVRLAFAAPALAGYVLGTSLVQIGYQSGSALTIAGIATLLTNALPIAAGTVLLAEPVPGGLLGGLRVLAFAAVVAGAALLARAGADAAADAGSYDPPRGGGAARQRGSGHTSGGTHMYKVVWFARYPQGKTREEASRYWSEHHGPLAAGTGIELYIQNHVTGPVPAVSGVPEEETFFDGYSCGWWRDRAAFEATMASPEWAEVVADGANVFDMAWLGGMSAALREHTVIPGPSSPFKVLWICRFKEGIAADEAHRYWEQVHGPIFAELEIDRYVQNHVVGPLEEGDSVGFDGFSECWFKNEEQFIRAIESDAWARAVEDGPNFLDMSQLWGAVVSERVMKGDRELAAA